MPGVLNICGTQHCPTQDALNGINAAYHHEYHQCKKRESNHDPGRRTLYKSGEDVYKMSFDWHESYDSVEELVINSEEIIVGKIIKRLSVKRIFGTYINESGEYVEDFHNPYYVREYLVRIFRIPKSNNIFSFERYIIVQRPSDFIEGKKVEYDFDNFSQGENVVLFLKKFIGPNGTPMNTYQILGKEEGHFSIKRGRIYPKSKKLNSNSRTARSTDETVNAFLNKVESLIQTQE